MQLKSTASKVLGVVLLLVVLLMATLIAFTGPGHQATAPRATVTHSAVHNRDSVPFHAAPKPTPTHTATPKPTTTPIITLHLPKQIAHTYTVKPGDTLWTISQHVFHTPFHWATLWHVNHIHNPNLIYVGQVLMLE